MSAECTRCGACCVAPDIAALGKPLGEQVRNYLAVFDLAAPVRLVQNVRPASPKPEARGPKPLSP